MNGEEATPDAPRPRRQGDSAADDSAALDDAARALFRLGRLFGRRAPDRFSDAAERGVELSRVLVAQAVEPDPAERDREVTVSVVAERLAIDPSTASRLVAEAIRDGYLARAPSPVDARRVRLELTEAGRALNEDARRHQRAVFDRVTRGWSDRERREFARLFVKFAAAVEEARAAQDARQ